MSSKQVKILHRTSPKSVRKELMFLEKHPRQRLMHLKEIQKPEYVTVGGKRIKYEGP